MTCNPVVLDAARLTTLASFSTPRDFTIGPGGAIIDANGWALSITGQVTAQGIIAHRLKPKRSRVSKKYQPVDWTGRIAREDKRGKIAADHAPILETLGVARGEWLPSVTELQARFELVIGSPERIRCLAESNGRSFYRGYTAARQLYLARLSA